MSQHNLPSQLTKFVGRTQEIAEIVDRLNNVDCRLLTLIGSGGIGKTRLALAVAETQISNFTEGVWLVRLQSITTFDRFVATISKAIDFSYKGGDEPHQQLLNYLNNKNILLVLDNFEQLLDKNVLDFLTDILTATSSVKLLVISREALKMQEEWRYMLKGLSIPLSDIHTYDDMGAYEAIQLFIMRANKINPYFDPINKYDCIIRICRLVEGMPLAIEMATSWISSLSCHSILANIERGLLSTRLRNVTDRHRSILAIFEQSWALLSVEERDVFSKLSIFVGGFHNDVAKIVADADSYNLATFVDKSLLQLDQVDRYRIHELTRQFAIKKLNDFPEKKATVLNLYCEYYATFLERREHKFRTQQSPQVLKELEQEIENIQAMWSQAIIHSKIAPLKKTVRFLAEYYDYRHWYHEGVTILEQIIETFRDFKPIGDYGLVLGVALSGSGNLLHNLGEIDRAEKRIREGISILRTVNTQPYLVWALGNLNRLLFALGFYHEAEKSYRESIALAKEANDVVTLAYELGRLGYIVNARGKYHEANLLRQEALLHFRSIKHRLGEALILGAIGETHYNLGDYEQAQATLQESLIILHELDSLWHIASQLQRLGHATLALGQHEEAKEHLNRSLEIANNVDDPLLITLAHLSCGELYTIHGDYEQAKQHFENALSLSKKVGLRLQLAQTLYGLGKLAYQTADYRYGELYLRESLSLSRELQSKLDIGKVLIELGRIAIQLGNETDTQDCFYEALIIATTIESKPLILDTLLAISEIIIMHNNPMVATELLLFSLYHPKCHAGTKRQIEILITELKEILTLQEFSTAQQRGQQYNLEEVVRNCTLTLSASQRNALSVSNRLLHEPLTPRELEVLKLIVKAYNNREISGQLHISVNTVKKHINHIFSKLDVKNRSEAIAKTYKLNILPNTFGKYS